jgi:hypothetical protein
LADLGKLQKENNCMNNEEQIKKYEEEKAKILEFLEQLQNQANNATQRLLMVNGALEALKNEESEAIEEQQEQTQAQ